VYDGSAWAPSARWAGKELTAACACGERVLCAALDDQAYLVQGADVVPIKLPERSDWIYGAAAVSDDMALLGGAGGLFELSIDHRAITRRRLSEFNISRPGRHVLRIVRAGERTLVLGKKNLLVEYRGGSAIELVDRRAISAELFFTGAVQLGTDLWLTGSHSLRPFLARLAGNAVQFEDLPLTGKSLPVLAALGDELLVGAERVLARRSGQWRELISESTVGARIASIMPLPSPSSHSICAVSSDGTSWFMDGRGIVEIDIF
jgi:hypothetical protein